MGKKSREKRERRAFDGMTPSGNSPVLEAGWLAQFRAEPEDVLNETQRAYLAVLRKEFPELIVGRKNGVLHAYAVPPGVGPLSFDLT